jgi:NADPH2:quinone reductase
MASAKLFEMVSNGKIKISINQRFPLEEVAKAHEALSGRFTTGCTILTP